MKPQNFYEDMSLFHVGTKPPRSYYIPYESSSKALDFCLEKSERLYNLCGEWSFAYYDSIDLIPEQIIGNNVRLADWDKIAIPSNWQLFGYDIPQYLESYYPIPCDPPYIPTETPVGVYAKDFEVNKDWSTFRKYMIFEGIDACFYLYINGRFVGYSEVSSALTEFDITDFIFDGQNRINVLVMKWGKCTYLESKNSWRLSGIYRNTYILARPKGHISDFFVKTSLSDDFRIATVEVQVDAPSFEGIMLTLAGVDGSVISRTFPDSLGNAQFIVESPVLWSAETPELYTLIIEQSGEYICQKVGIREIKWQNGAFRINGKDVKLHGVYLQSFDPKLGYVTNEEMNKTDLILMKQNNVNAIFTSTPPDPRFLELCNQYGFYVVDNADIHTNGANSCCDPDLFARNTEWQAAICDRASLLVERDKNQPCVVIWSMGGSCGWGENIIAAILQIKNKDTSRPIYCEGASSHYTGQEGFPKEPDFISYSPLSNKCCLDSIIKGVDTRPILLCKYYSTQGNSSGGLFDYWNIISSHSRITGAFINQWCEQAIYGGETLEGTVKFLKGSDFGDVLNDGNACINGLVTPDRKINPTLLELKAVSSPVKINSIDIENGEFEIFNLYDFIYLSRIECKYEISRYGEIVKSETLGVFSIPPHKSQKIRVQYSKPNDGVCFIRFIFSLLGETSFALDGFEIASTEFRLPVEIYRIEKPFDKEPLTLREKSKSIEILGDGFVYTFNKSTASFGQLSIQGKKLLNCPMKFDIYRAPTGGDTENAKEIIAAGYDKASIRVYDVTLDDINGNVVISTDISFVTPGLPPHVYVSCIYKVDVNGKISINCDVRVNESAPYLPRFGVTLSMPKEYSDVEFFGLGPMENYIDRKQCAHMGRFSSSVINLMTNYTILQENANHHNTYWSSAYNNEMIGLLIFSNKSYDFSALPYSQTDFINAKHYCDLPPISETVLRASYLQTTPSPNFPNIENSLLKAKRFSFSINMLPSNFNNTSAWISTLTDYK